MYKTLAKIKTEVYEPCSLALKSYQPEIESTAYDACRYELNGRLIISRKAKITPKKVGQFVTCWKRNSGGPIEPFSEADCLDFYAINVQRGSRIGQFVFPKSVLIQEGIISTSEKDGKRGFRVYPAWESVSNKQAQRTQNWQLDYFYEINSATDLSKVAKLYGAQH